MDDGGDYQGSGTTRGMELYENPHPLMFNDIFNAHHKRGCTRRQSGCLTPVGFVYFPQSEAVDADSEHLEADLQWGGHLSMDHWHSIMNSGKLEMVEGRIKLLDNTGVNRGWVCLRDQAWDADAGSGDGCVGVDVGSLAAHWVQSMHPGGGWLTGGCVRGGAVWWCRSVVPLCGGTLVVALYGILVSFGVVRAGIVLDSGIHIPCDLIVYCTGFSSSYKFLDARWGVCVCVWPAHSPGHVRCPTSCAEVKVIRVQTKP